MDAASETLVRLHHLGAVATLTYRPEPIESG